MDEELLYFNGINGKTGKYGVPAMTGKEVDGLVERIVKPPAQDRFNELKERLKRNTLQQIKQLRDKILSADSAEDLAAGVMLPSRWQSSFLQHLALLPAETIKAASISEVINSVAFEKLMFCLDGIRRIEGEGRSLGTWLQDEDLAGIARRIDARDADTQAEARRMLRRFHNLGRQLARRDNGSLLRAPLLETWARDWAAQILDSNQRIQDALRDLNEQKAPVIAQLESLAVNANMFNQTLLPLHNQATALSETYWKKILRLYDVSWSNIIEMLNNALTSILDIPHIPWYDLLKLFDDWLVQVAAIVGDLGVKEGVDATNIAEAGWCVIFPSDNALVPQIKEALQPLLDLRAGQTPHFKVYEGKDGYHTNQTARKFLIRQGARPSDPADPDKVPYYVLLVGSPAEIPYDFQYEMDVQYAVGRIDFGDNLQAYNTYARSVVAAENGQLKLPRKAAFFGVQNPDDKATQLSAQHLVHPLCEALKDQKSVSRWCAEGQIRRKVQLEWNFQEFLGELATKAQLKKILGGNETPPLLFTASHGMEFPLADELQVSDQGALLCQDWPGPSCPGEIPTDYYFSAGDLSPEANPDANLLGTIAFFFACYSAGTPLNDEFSRQFFKDREAIAEEPFTAALPKAMLSCPQGGALAVIGHVERAWETSFMGERGAGHLTTFRSVIEHLLKGYPVGSAMEYFNVRYAALSAELNLKLDEVAFDATYPEGELASLWTENKDAGGYVIIGDPAVRLPIAIGDGEPLLPRFKLEDGPEFVAPVIPSPELLPKPNVTEITAADWEQTPLSVKRYVQQLEERG